MQFIKNELIHLMDVKNFLPIAANSKKIVCIGVDGPTASGKTIFAELLKDELEKCSNKNVQIVPLDSLLVERSLRENSLQRISNAGIPFEHEAELHMEFRKLNKLLKLIRMAKKGLSFDRSVTLKNLYSREDEGRCTGELNFDICDESILIFEGHYTTRPEFSDVLDRNFILLAERDELIKRKIDRVAAYRDKKEVTDYFDLIDEPSYLSNYYRFADQSSSIIDNSDFSHPRLVDYNHIKTLLDASKFSQDKSILVDQINEFIFGVHGLSKFLFGKDDKLKNLLQDLNDLENLKSRNVVSEKLGLNGIPHEIVYFDYISSNNSEVGLYLSLLGKNIIWIIRKNFREVSHLIFWEGGAFKIQDCHIERLSSEKSKNKPFQDGFEDFWNTIYEGKGFATHLLLNKKIENGEYGYCFMNNSRRVSFLATALAYTQFSTRSLGDFFVVSSRGCLPDKIEELTASPEIIDLSKIKLSLSPIKSLEIDTISYLLTQDFLILKKTLDRNAIKELREIYFNSEDEEIRSVIITGLLHQDNAPFVSTKLRDFLQFSSGFFPSSMSRLYSLKKMGLESTNVMAANIYDLTRDPVDSTAYLECAIENSYPTILQVSLNAAGQSETDESGIETIGYLRPKNGIFDFTNSICDTVVDLLQSPYVNKLPPPFFGIGLDHVDVRGDNPSGRSSRFVQQANDTEAITHLTLDGSGHFKPINKSRNELFNAYVKVFKTSLSFLEINKNINVDLEFCTGELNYIGEETDPHYPDGEEMSILPACFEHSFDDLMDQEWSVALSNNLKLYVGNLGTTHHGKDNSSSLNLHLAEEWQNSLSGTNFVSPVLHGTTGSYEETFKVAAKSCQKINIAGSFLKVFLENLNTGQKKDLGFTGFDDKSKFLCVNMHRIKKDKVKNTKNALKNEFTKYCRVNDVRPISKHSEQLVRKPLFGRNSISAYIFSRLEQML